MRALPEPGIAEADGPAPAWRPRRPLPPLDAVALRGTVDEVLEEAFREWLHPRDRMGRFRALMGELRSAAKAAGYEKHDQFAGGTAPSRSFLHASEFAGRRLEELPPDSDLREPLLRMRAAADELHRMHSEGDKATVGALVGSPLAGMLASVAVGNPLPMAVLPAVAMVAGARRAPREL